MAKNDKIRYSEAFKLKVIEELRDGKFKSVKDVAMGYGISEMSVYNWMHRLEIVRRQTEKVCSWTFTPLEKEEWEVGCEN